MTSKKDTNNGNDNSNSSGNSNGNGNSNSNGNGNSQYGVLHFIQNDTWFGPVCFGDREKTMSSIATKQGDGGLTGLVGGRRVSKADQRVEAYGCVDELGAALGLARSMCRDKDVAGWTEEIQRTLFRVGGSLATPAEARKASALMTGEDVDRLTGLVEKIEGMEGILSDWSLPGAYTESAVYEVARTVCRRAEREVVRFVESGGEVQAEVVAYLNRLSDLIWLFGRMLELKAGVDARLRTEDKAGPAFSRAW